MGSVLIHECDVCKNAEKGSTISRPPRDWFEFDYEYGGKSESITYLVCSFKCYIVMLHRCIEWSNSHTNVRIAGMSRHFAKKLIERVDVIGLSEKVEFKKEKNEGKKERMEIFESEPEEIEAVVIEEKESLEHVKKGKIISIKVDSADRLEWLEEFAANNSDEKLLNKTNSIWEHDNIITYDSLIDTEAPLIPLIRYKSHYILFIHESAQKFFNFTKNKNTQPA